MKKFLVLFLILFSLFNKFILLLGTILDFKNRLTGDKTAREISANLYEFINENNIQTKINQMADEIEKKSRIQPRGRFSQELEAEKIAM